MSRTGWRLASRRRKHCSSGNLRLGDKHLYTAIARGALAVGYVRARKHADATREFKASIPILMAAVREKVDSDDATVVAAHRSRLQSELPQAHRPRRFPYRETI